MRETPHSSSPTSPNPDADDVLIGAKAIAEFLWGDKKLCRRIYYYLETPGRIPVYRDPWSGRLFASRPSLNAWRYQITNHPPSGGSIAPRPG